MKFAKGFFSLYLGLFSYTHAVNLDLGDLSEKKNQIQKAYQKYKEKKTSLKSKYKKAKEEIKAKLKLFGAGASLSIDEKEEIYVYLSELNHRMNEGSLEAINEACEFFETNNISHLDDAIAFTLGEINIPSNESLVIEFCKKYIGDDGMEYDDGEEETEAEEISFYSIPLHAWEKKVIEKIITSLAEKSLAQLLLERKEMEKRGDQIHHVHPLRFMGHAFADPYLKSCILQFRNNSFKWSNFIDGFVQRMKEEMASGNVVKHVEGFCEHLKVNAEDVYEFVNKGNYADLLFYLLDQ